MRLSIGICSHRDIKAAFVKSLLDLVFELQRTNVEFDVFLKTNVSNIVLGRQAIVNEAIEQGYTHMLFLDDDMTFPANIVEMLAGHGKEFVAANYRKKNSAKVLGTAVDLGRTRVDSSEKTGLMEVHRVGLGCFLADVEALKAMGHVHFAMIQPEGVLNVIGEDDYFCAKARDCGFKIFIDHDASRAVGHLGDLTYSF